MDVSDYDGLPTPCSPYGVAVKMFNITIKSILRTPHVADCENGTANTYQCLPSTALHAKWLWRSELSFVWYVPNISRPDFTSFPILNKKGYVYNTEVELWRVALPSKFHFGPAESSVPNAS